MAFLDTTPASPRVEEADGVVSVFGDVDAQEFKERRALNGTNEPVQFGRFESRHAHRLRKQFEARAVHLGEAVPVGLLLVRIEGG